MNHPPTSGPSRMITVAPADVRRSGAALSDVAGVVGRVRAEEPLGGIADAIPGSISAASSDTLAVVWQEAFDGWVRAIGIHARSLRTAAADYESVDDLVAATLEETVAVVDPEVVRRPGDGAELGRTR